MSAVGLFTPSLFLTSTSSFSAPTHTPQQHQHQQHPQVITTGKQGYELRYFSIHEDNEVADEE